MREDYLSCQASQCPGFSRVRDKVGFRVRDKVRLSIRLRIGLGGRFRARITVREARFF